MNKRRKGLSMPSIEEDLMEELWMYYISQRKSSSRDNLTDEKVIT